MENIKDFFSNITPIGASLLLIAFGVLLIIRAISRWKWILDISGERKRMNIRLLLYNLFGYKGLGYSNDYHRCYHYSLCPYLRGSYNNFLISPSHYI